MTEDTAIRLLLVEDNPAHADLTTEWLSDVPGHVFEVIVAATLDDALRSTQENDDFDAVLLDLNLPDSRGIETVKRLREAHGELPVVVVSSLVDDELRREALANGAQDVVDKRDTSSMILPRSILYAAELGRRRSRQEQIQSLVAAAPEAMVVVDRDGRVNFSNAAADQLSDGLQLVGERLSVDHEDSDGIALSAERLSLRGETRLGNFEWDGEPASLIVIRDLADRRARLEAEAKASAAEESLELFKQVVERMPVGVRLMQRGEDDQFVPTWENAAATTAWGLPNTPSLASLSASAKAAVQTLGPLALPDIRDDRTTPATIFAVQVAPITNNLVGVFSEEVTERISLAAQLRQAQKMEAVGRMAGGIAHDFNNLLTVIISFAGLVRDSLDDSGLAAQDLDEVLGAADRAAILTRQLLAVSRRQPVAPEVLDLNEAVMKISRMLARTLGEDIELVVVPESEIHPVFMDRGHFEQIMMNLAVNARDAMPKGGKLFIEIRNVSGDHDMGDHVLVEVSDTGEGMPAEVMAHVFEPFFTTKEHGKGTGLGLAMAYGMVAQASGSINVKSSPDQGTVFEIRLPRTSMTHRPSRVLGPSTGDFRGDELVLVVEDEPRVRDVVRRFLLPQGYRMIEAGNGEEGLRVFAEYADRIDLVISDVVMPRMNGQEFAERMRRDFGGCRVLFMTGYTSDAIPVQPQAVGNLKSHFWLEKPFTEEQLLTRVRQVLDAEESEAN